MITRLNIKNFKCHKDTPLTFRPLTLLTGVNSSGKTSVLQSLLLLRQSKMKNVLSEGLELNECLCEIGTATDALCKSAMDSVVSFDIQTEKEEYKFCFDASVTKESFIPLSDAPIGLSKLKELSLFTTNFQYISASRWGGRSKYPKDTRVVENERQISLRFGQGELVANFLYKYGGETPIVCESDDSEKTLLGECMYWEGLISRGVKFDVVPGDDDKSYKINYRYEQKGMRSIEKLSAENIGFGISYSLPVIVALLSSKPGSLIIIENPEAHIHPRGQSYLMKLVSLVVKKGVQVIIETHSDHIMNASLVALHNNQISKDEVAAYYFDCNEETFESEPYLLDISESGRVKCPPKGFFDQIDIDLKQILGF